MKLLRNVPKAALALLLAIMSLAACTRKQKPEVDADLVIYTSHPDDLARTIVDEFRERTGLRVRIVSDGTGALLARLDRGDGEDADVLWGGGAESLVANLSLFEAYASPEREAIPESLRDEDGFWTGFTVLPMVIIVNSRLVPVPDLPRRWADLVLPGFADSVAFANPASSGSAYTILRTMLVAGSDKALDEGGWRLIEGFVDAIGGSPVEESALVYSGVAAGEYLAGVTYENAGADAQRLGSDVRIIYPADGTSAVPDGVAILNGASHPAAARRFVDFVLGYDVARVVTARFKRRSARSDAPVPEGLPPLETIRLLDYDFDASVTQREATIERFRRLTENY